MQLTHIIINSLLCAGIYGFMLPGNLGGKYLRPTLAKLLPEFIKKPTFSCLICMSSVWGLLFWWGMHPQMFASLALFLVEAKCLVPHIFALCGLNTIFDALLNYLRTNFAKDKKPETLSIK